MKIPASVLDLLERAGKSGLQQFLVIAFAASSGVHAVSSIPWYQSVGVGAGAAVVSVLTSLATWNVPVLNFKLDLLLRVGKTIAQSLVATFGADAINVFNVNWIHAINISLGAGLLSLVTGLISAGVVSGAGVSGPSASLVYSTPLHEAVETGKATASDLAIDQITPTAVAPITNVNENYDPKHDTPGDIPFVPGTPVDLDALAKVDPPSWAK